MIFERLNRDIQIKNVEWPDQIASSGMYTHTANDNTKMAANKWLPYTTDGNAGDGWTIIAVAYSTRYIGLFASQINGTRGGIGWLDTTDKSMAWIKFER